MLRQLILLSLAKCEFSSTVVVQVIYVSHSRHRQKLMCIKYSATNLYSFTPSFERWLEIDHMFRIFSDLLFAVH